ncbi:multiheme c-type cytochrome [Sandarakinorhabdus oryzae]|uniref:multiheme c-type cytochrome n=1 Tax=Sandarakinorhabdus oryzae TaxID=2675220 RepID=UPI0012E19112|nr:multiheme c-type cytochrome [Sandarakinorhabdus oryzae]
MAAGADAAPIDRALHQGVASCAGSTCHGRQEATGPRVRQNEVMTWSDPASLTGVHSRAWRVLNEPRAQAIGRRLGITNVAAAPACISCHGDPATVRGPRWQQSDGVGCEACHGGSERWLASHASVKASHADNVARGMWALNDPAVRASVCLDCHFGSDKPGQFVFHRLMAAGHPRIAFELDLFTALQRHHNEDADYAARKGVAGGVKTWAVGQALAVERALSLLPAQSASLTGPDFTFYDCRSCHRTFSDDPAVPIVARTNSWRPIPPGQPVWNDEQMIMLAAAARVAAPDVARSFEAQSRAFHTAMGGDRAGAMKAAAALKATAATLARRFAATAFDRAQTFALIEAVLVGNAAAYTDYQGGAQAVMAADTLLSALVTAGQVNRAAAVALRPDLDRAYALARDANRWDAPAFQAALAQIATRMRALK